LKVLIIDGNEDILDIQSFILKDAGYEVLSTNIPPSLEEFGRIMPDLVLLDQILPTGYGSELSLQLKNNQNTQNITVVLFSTIPHCLGGVR